MLSLRVIPLLAGLLIFAIPLSLTPTPAAAESGVEFAMPPVIGDIPASTYDETGERVGDASLSLEHLPNGNIVLAGLTGIDGSARADVRAEFAPIPGSERVRLVYQRSESHNELGQSMGVMAIDHLRGVATCTPVDGEPVEIALPPQDRVVNIPLNLLFEPLARGEAQSVDFQLLLCRVRGGKIFDARAHVAENRPSEEGRIVEIRTNLDLGPMLSRLAAPFMPRMSIWFNQDSPGAWIAHRMPLFTKGPTVFVVRSGFTPALLGIGE